MDLFESVLNEREFKPYFIITKSFEQYKYCDSHDNETEDLRKAKRFETKEDAEEHIKYLMSRPSVSYNVFDEEQRKAGCPGGDFAYNRIYNDGSEARWKREHFAIVKITKEDWEKVWQDGANERLRKSDESSNILRTILEKGKSGKTLYRIIDKADRLYSDEKEHIVNLRITCTTSDPEKLLFVANATGRDAYAIVEFSDNTIAYEMKKTSSRWTDEAEHLIFGKFKVIRQDEPFTLKDGYSDDCSFVYFKAEPLDQSGEFAKALVKKRISHYKDDEYDHIGNKIAINDILYKKTIVESKGDNMDLFNRVLKEADEVKLNKDLLKKYEEVNGWDFIDDEDFPGLNNIAEAFAKICDEMYGEYYTIKQFNPKTGDGSKNIAFVRVNGYGHKGEVDDYRMYLAFDQTLDSWGEKSNKASNPIYAYIKKSHKSKSDFFGAKKDFQKYLERKFKSLTSICEQNGFKIVGAGCDPIKRNDSSYYIYIDLKPEEKINRINNTPVDQKLQKIVDLVTEGMEKLAQREDTIYWLGHAGYEGSEVIISTCLTTDQTKEYPSDSDDSGVAKNSNYGQPILYLDIPNHGYANWNSGSGYITGSQVATMDDVRRIAKKFNNHLNDLGNDVYSNSNY